MFSLSGASMRNVTGFIYDNGNAGAVTSGDSRERENCNNF